MKNQIVSHKWFVLFSAVVLVSASVITVAVFSAKRQQPKTQQPNEWLTSIPRVLSQVKDLEIINERIIRPNTDMAGVTFEILNKSNRAVMAVRVTSGHASISKDGFEDEEHPIVIIEPYGTLSAEMTELTHGAPIVISSATFQDATEEGDNSSVEFMQKLRARERDRHKAERERRSAGRGPNQ
jgi:hypothetical protein